MLTGLLSFGMRGEYKIEIVATEFGRIGIGFWRSAHFGRRLTHTVTAQTSSLCIRLYLHSGIPLANNVSASSAKLFPIPPRMGDGNSNGRAIRSENWFSIPPQLR